MTLYLLFFVDRNRLDCVTCYTDLHSSLITTIENRESRLIEEPYEDRNLRERTRAPEKRMIARTSVFLVRTPFRDIIDVR